MDGHALSERAPGTPPRRLPSLLEFSRVYKEGRRFSGTSLILYVRATSGGLRVGVAAGRRIGGAVVRNRAKRRLREAFRRLQGRLDDRGDVALIARPPAVTAPFPEIVSEVEALCVAGGLLRDKRA